MKTTLALLFAACLVLNAAAQYEDSENTFEEDTLSALTEGLIVEQLETPAQCIDKALSGQRVAIEYLGTFENGEVFVDSSVRGGPMTLVLGKGEVMRGLDSGLAGMCVGEKRKLVIPPNLGYGVKGQPGFIPSMATLIMEVKLVGVNVPEDRED